MLIVQVTLNKSNYLTKIIVTQINNAPDMSYGQYCGAFLEHSIMYHKDVEKGGRDEGISIR